EEEEPEDLDEEDLEALTEDEDILEDDDVLEDDAVEDDAVEDEDVVAGKAKAPAAADEEDEEEEEDEILDADDVEASLDVILKDRLVVEEEDEEEEEEEAPDPEERAEGATKVPPKRPDEFVCQSCFLVKHPSQLADAKRQLCRDCV